MAGRHQELTMVCVVVTIESEGVRAELATCARMGAAVLRCRQGGVSMSTMHALAKRR